MFTGGSRRAAVMIGLAGALGACDDASVRPPTPVALPGHAPTPRPPGPETPPGAGPSALPRPGPAPTGPVAPGAGADWPSVPTAGPDVALPVLPPAWPRGLPAVAPAGPAVRTVHGAAPVALAFDGLHLGDALVVYDAEGGRRTQTGRLPFTRANAVLGSGVLRVETAGRVHLACAGEAAPAAWSLDAGETFAPAAFTCGHGARRTAALADGRVFALLSDDTLGLGRSGDAVLTPRALPGRVEAIAVLPPVVLLFGDGVAWRSEDDGETFVPVDRPADGPRVREALFLAKARVVAVGDAPGGPRGPGVMVSEDGGRRFVVPTELPRHTGALAAVASHDAHLLAVPVNPGEAVYSDDDGRTLRLPRGPAGWVGAVVAARGGFVALRAAPTLGFAADVAGLGGVTLPAIDAVPLRDAVFPHPRLGLAVDAAGRLLRSMDGGHTWGRVAGSVVPDLRGLARADDAYGLWLATAEGLAVAQSPGAASRRIARPCPEARLNPLADGSVAAACADGSWLRLRAPDDIEALGPAPGGGSIAAAMPADGGALVVLEADGTHLALGRAGQPWRRRAVPVPEGRRAVALATDGGALLVVLDDGRRWVLSRFDGAFQARGSALAAGEGVRAALALRGGEMLFATTAGVLRVDGEGRTTRIAPTTDVTALRTTGDGGLVALGPNATTVLTPR